MICLFVLLPLYFPNGRLLSPRLRPVMWYAVVLATIMTALAVLCPSSDETLGIPNPFGVQWIAPLFEEIPYIWTILWLSLGVAATASHVPSESAAHGEERQQIKWVVYAVLLLVVTTIVSQLFFVGVESRVGPVLLLLGLQGLWVAVAVAVFKYRLYNIDVLINRTSVYGTLTALLAEIYVGSVALQQRVLAPFITHNNQIVVIASTLVIAGLFQPLRRRIQAMIDRRFYLQRYSAPHAGSLPCEAAR